MAVCSNCHKQIPSCQNTFTATDTCQESIYDQIADDREMSRFLYRMTQEIVTSRDYSDASINRICAKYFQNSSFPDKDRLQRIVIDLKRKLRVQQNGVPSANHVCSCDRPGKRTSKAETLLSKATSIQSFDLLPREQKNAQTQADDPHVEKLQFRSSFLDPADTVGPGGDSQPDSSTDSSISTITTYNFSDYSSSTLIPERRHSKSSRQEYVDNGTLLSHVLIDHGGGSVCTPVHAPEDGCCGRRDSKDSSADMVMRLAASNLVYKGAAGQARKCPLHRCERYGQVSSACAAAGGCGGGCASDFPMDNLDLEEVESPPPTTCCGRKRKKKPANNGKKKPDAAGKKNANRCATNDGKRGKK